MKQRLALLCCLSVLLPDLLHSAEFTTLDGEHYTGATIKRVDPDGLLVTYPDGVVKIKFKNLPKEVGEKYGYDPTKEATFLAEKRAHDLAAYQEVVRLQNHGADTIIPTTSSVRNSLNSSTSNRIEQPSLSTKTVEWIKQSKNWILHFFNGGPVVIELISQPTPSVSAPTPKPLASRVLESSSVHSDDLGEFIDRNTDSIQPLLEKKVFQITGPIEEIKTAGIQADKAEVTVVSHSRHRIVVVMNQSKFVSTNTHSLHGEWKVVGGDLFLFRGTRADGISYCKAGGSLPPFDVRLAKVTSAAVYFNAL